MNTAAENGPTHLSFDAIARFNPPFAPVVGPATAAVLVASGWPSGSYRVSMLLPTRYDTTTIRTPPPSRRRFPVPR